MFYERRQKVNKYRQDNHNTKDPLEQLMEESERKLELINQEAESRRRNPKQQQQQKNKEELFSKLKDTPLSMAFPDNKDIDPNDPSSFGFVEIGTVVGAHGVHGQIKVKSSSDFPSRFTEPGLRYFKPHNKRAPRKVILLQGKSSKQGEYILQLDDVATRDEATRLRGGSLYVRIEERDSVSSSSSSPTSSSKSEPVVEVAADDDEQQELLTEGDSAFSTTTTTSEEEYFISELVGLEVFLEQEDENNDNSNGQSESDDAPVNSNNYNNKNNFVGYVAGVVLAQEMCAIPGLGHDMLEITIPRGKGGTVSLRDELVLVPFVPEIVPRVELSERAIFLTPPSGLLDLTYVREEKVRIKGFLPAPAGDDG